MANKNLPAREKFQINSGDLALRRNGIGLTEEDLELIRKSKDFLAPEANRIVAEFHDFGLPFRDFSQVANPSGSNRLILESALKSYSFVALDGKLDEDYMDNRPAAGSRHAELDIQPAWNLGSYVLFTSLIYPILMEHMEGETLRKTCVAWTKVMLFDLMMAIEGYISEGMLTRLVGAGASIGQVSGEVTAGAGQVGTAAQEIAKCAGAAQQGARDMVEAMQAGVSGAEKGVEIASEAGEALRNIVENDDQLSEGICRVIPATKTNAEQTDQLPTAMNEMAGVAQQLELSSNRLTESSDNVGQAAAEASPQAEEPAASDQEVSASLVEAAAQNGEMNTKTDDLGKQFAFALNPNHAVPYTSMVRHMRKQQLQQFLTVREAATLFKVKEPTIQRWCRQGHIPALKCGKSWRIRWDAAS